MPIKEIQQRLEFYHKKHYKLEQKWRKLESELSKTKNKKLDIVYEIQFIKNSIKMIDEQISKLIDEKRYSINNYNNVENQSSTGKNKFNIPKI